MDLTLYQLGLLANSPGDRATRAHAAAEYIRAARGYHWVGLYDVTDSRISAIAWTGTSPPAHPTFPRTDEGGRCDGDRRGGLGG